MIHGDEVCSRSDSAGSLRDVASPGRLLVRYAGRGKSHVFAHLQDVEERDVLYAFSRDRFKSRVHREKKRDR